LKDMSCCSTSNTTCAAMMTIRQVHCSQGCINWLLAEGADK
jgi:hypothetical protein